VETLIVPTSKKIEQIILAGDDTRKYVTCFVVPYQQPFRKYADENNIPYTTWSDLIRNPIILKMIKDEIMELTKDVSEYSRPKKFAISCKEFSEEEGYMTPSSKFKKDKIFRDYSDVLDQLYEIENEFLIIEDRLID